MHAQDTTDSLFSLSNGSRFAQAVAGGSGARPDITGKPKNSISHDCPL